MTVLHMTYQKIIKLNLLNKNIVIDVGKHQIELYLQSNIYKCVFPPFRVDKYIIINRSFNFSFAHLIRFWHFLNNTDYITKHNPFLVTWLVMSTTRDNELTNLYLCGQKKKKNSIPFHFIRQKKPRSRVLV